MNYGLGMKPVHIIELQFMSHLAISLRLEKFLAQLIADGVEEDQNDSLEDKAMRMAAQEVFEESGNRFKPWCSNGKSIRIGEIILIVDSDTIVPEVRGTFSSLLSTSREKWNLLITRTCN